MQSHYFFSADWGTTKLRLRCVNLAVGEVVCEHSSDRGTVALAAEAQSQNAQSQRTLTQRKGAEEDHIPADQSAAARARLFSQTLATALQELYSAPLFPREHFSEPESRASIVVSGMASSTIGWKLLPQAQTPFPLDGSQAVIERLDAPSELPNWVDDVLLVSGVATERDSMRGEEVQILGLFGDPEFECERFASESLVILPGTHSKQIAIRDHAVRAFSTYMTGELFSVLGEQTILRHSVDTKVALDFSSASIQHSFQLGVADSSEHALSRTLFGVRIRQIMDNQPTPENTAYFTGLLIGAELVDGRTTFGTKLPVIVAANEHLLPQYRRALEVLGFQQILALTPDQSERLVSSGQRCLLERASSGRN